jgi:hypothetical protein
MMEFDRNTYIRNMSVPIFTWKELENFEINWKNSVKSEEKRKKESF